MRTNISFVVAAGLTLLVANAMLAVDLPANVDSRYQGFAEQLSSEITSGDTAGFERALDVDALLDRTLLGIEVSEKAKRGFRDGFKESFAKNFSQNFAAVGSYKLLRIRKTNDQTVALFRMLNEDGSLNYHDLYLAPRGKEGVRVVDIHIFVMGERMSVSLRRIALAALAATERSLLDRLIGTENEWVAHRDKVSQLPALVRQKKYKEALDLYAKLPPGLQKEKTMLIQRLMAAAQSDEKEYQKAIALWEKTYPRDPSLALISLDGLILKQQYEEAIAQLDQLNASIGGDPYVDVMRAGQYRLLKKWDKAKECSRQALRAEPDMPQAYDSLLTVSLDESDFEETARLLAQVEKAFNSDLTDTIRQSEEYAAFRKSKAHSRWLDGKKASKAQN